ncbi:hypothetical protein ACO3UB_00890 [Methanocaldococcus sp. 16A]
MRKILLILLHLLFLNSIYGYYFGYIKVNENTLLYEKDFKINKDENYKYKLYFVHYGNINENMKVKIYLNDNLIYTIDDANDGSGNYKKKVIIDITDYLENGENVLKVEGINIKGNETYHPYYVLDECYIDEPMKTSITFGSVFLTLILIGLIILYSPKKNFV